MKKPSTKLSKNESVAPSSQVPSPESRVRSPATPRPKQRHSYVRLRSRPMSTRHRRRTPRSGPGGHRCGPGGGRQGARAATWIDSEHPSSTNTPLLSQSRANTSLVLGHSLAHSRHSCAIATTPSFSPTSPHWHRPLELPPLDDRMTFPSVRTPPVLAHQIRFLGGARF